MEVQIGQVLRHIQKKGWLVKIIRITSSIIEVEVMAKPNNEDPKYNQRFINIRRKRVERSWKVDRIGTVLYGKLN